jgi:hypothetical protein
MDVGLAGFSSEKRRQRERAGADEGRKFALFWAVPKLKGWADHLDQYGVIRNCSGRSTLGWRVDTKGETIG